MASALLSRIPGFPHGTAGEVRGSLAPILSGEPDWQSRPAPETVPTGIPEVDALTGGLPRGCLTEIAGPASSGRTSLLLSVLAQAGARDETCALIDAADAFDPVGAAAAGVALEKLLWVRCGGDAERALKAADLLIQGGGFPLIAMDLADTPPATARRISLTSWFRLRRAVEHTPAVLIALEQQPNARTCASLVLECTRERTAWSGVPGCSQLLRGLDARIAGRKPVRAGAARFQVRVFAPAE
jgi:hypothetical protein